jgi:Trypsin-like peptidase domain
MPITRKYAERAQEHSANLSMTPFEFLQILLTEFGVFVPIDLNIDRALFGGMNYQQLLADRETRNNGFEVPPVRHVHETASGAAQHFFLPSLLGHTEPGDDWTFKTNEAWRTTLCHSIIFPDGVPSGLMERLTACVLNVIHIMTNSNTSKFRANTSEGRGAAVEGRLVVREVLCWRKTFILKLGLQQPPPDGLTSIVDIFAHLANQSSHLCVGSDYMLPGMHRLIISGRGPVGDGGRRIWKGGYLLVLKCLQRVMTEYEGVEFEENCVCPSCLANLHLKKACSWDMSALRAAAERCDDGLHCTNGHFVESRLVCGPCFPTREAVATFTNPDGIKPIEDLFEAVVIVGLWDGKSREIVRAGSGFIINKKRGLIVTAAHTLMEIWNDRDYPFGEDCYGLDRGKVVIGVIPRGGAKYGEAVFRYFAQIVCKDPNLAQRTCRVDACVLRIVSRLEHDVGGNGEACGSQAEIFLLNNSRLPKSDQLSTLKLAKAWQREEAVRVIGYNQGGEGLREPGETLNRSIDFAMGYVVRLFRNVPEHPSTTRRDRNFEPNEEIIVNCLTISGHSGGPCVNLQGEVIGILSRADPAENQRCYLVPASEIAVMVERAKRQQ